MILDLGGEHSLDVTHRAVVVGDLPRFSAGEWCDQMGALKQAARGMIQEGASLLCLNIPADMAAGEGPALLRSFFNDGDLDYAAVPVVVHSRNEPDLIDALREGATAVIADQAPKSNEERGSFPTEQTMWILPKVLRQRRYQRLAEVLDDAQGLGVTSLGDTAGSGAVVAVVVAGCRLLRTRRVRSVRRVADVVAVLLRERDRDVAARPPGSLR